MDLENLDSNPLDRWDAADIRLREDPDEDDEEDDGDDEEEEEEEEDGYSE